MKNRRLYCDGIIIDPERLFRFFPEIDQKYPEFLIDLVKKGVILQVGDPY